MVELPHAMDDTEIQRIEQAAVEIAMGAGAILLERFRKPLDIQYKQQNRRSPVTEADRAADTYIREQVAARFPSHSILSEEEEDSPADEAPAVWIIDPLDGTTNFLHGLPAFGVCIGVVEGDRLIAGAIFTPAIGLARGEVYHARVGGGAYLGNERLTLDGDTVVPQRDRLMATMPSHFAHMFKYHPRLWMNIGDVRAIGSVAYEMAMAARGVLDYVVFSGPRIWDVAAGILIIQEAGGEVLVRQGPRPNRRWRPFERFEGHEGPPTPQALRRWHGALILGRNEASRFVADGLGIRRNRLRRWYWRSRRWLAQRRQPTKQALAAESDPPPGPQA